jgi:tetratricopeptide (TPR) repeat protein
VHRDLKPDNVMIDGAGRVRVMDFGLAHGRNIAPSESVVLAIPAVRAGIGRVALSGYLTQAGAVQGTPLYMAPEQWEGVEAGPAADQYALCVTAWELLFGEPPYAGRTLAELSTAVCSGTRRPPPTDRGVPAWLRRIVERGLAVDPGQRWRDMDALIAALERGRARVGRRTAALAGLGVVAVIAAAAGQQSWREVEAAAACTAAGDQIERVWGPEVRASVRDGMIASGVVNAADTAERVLPWLDRHASAWRAARTELCDDQRHGLRDSMITARALWCLEERRVELAELVRGLGQPGPQVVQEAVSAAAGLRSPALCLDEGVLRRQPVPPVEERAEVREIQVALSHAGSLALAGDSEEALEQVRGARFRAEALGWPPLMAAARLREGLLSAKGGAYAAAEGALRAAYFTAARAEAWELAADAANALVMTVGFRLARHDEGWTWGEHAALAIERAGDPGSLREAERIENLAVVDMDRGDNDAAQTKLAQALVLRREAFGEEHPAVASTLNRLGVMLMRAGDDAGARELFERSRAIRARVLGPEHPHLASVLTNLADLQSGVGEHEAALQLFARVLAIEERALGPNHPNVALDLQNLASEHQRLGRRSEALALFERALIIQEQALGPDHPHLAIILDNLGTLKLELGAVDAARPLLERGLAIRERALGPDHPDVAISLLSIAGLELLKGNLAAAAAAGERALAISEQALGAEHADLALALGSLAEVRMAQRRPREAVALLTRANAIYDAIEGTQPLEAGSHLRLARALVGEDRDRAVAEARRARELALIPQVRAEIDVWLEEQLKPMSQ